MPGLRLTGHEPEFPRQFTLERIAGITEFLADSARKLRAELLVPRTLRSHRSGIAPCSTLGFVCFLRIAPRSAFSPLALPADLTRLSALGALRLLRIAPHSMPCARAGHGSPRATDCSVFST